MSDAGLAKVGDLEGVGSDPEDRRLSGQFGDGERDAIDAQGSFVDAEGMDRRRKRNFEPIVLAHGGEVEDLSGVIDMALDKVPAKAIADRKGSFQIDGTAFFQFSERGDLESLGKKVEANVIIECRCGEAATIDGDRVSEGEFSGERNVQNEAGLLTFFDEGDHPAGRFYKSGKHYWWEWVISPVAVL